MICGVPLFKETSKKVQKQMETRWKMEAEYSLIITNEGVTSKHEGLTSKDGGCRLKMEVGPNLC